MRLPYVALVALVVLNVGAMIGYVLGGHMASERFYDECQGGEMHYKSPSGSMLTAVGCAEMARHVR